MHLTTEESTTGFSNSRVERSPISITVLHQSSGQLCQGLQVCQTYISHSTLQQCFSKQQTYREKTIPSAL